jgi:hypothetical protein
VHSAAWLDQRSAFWILSDMLWEGLFHRPLRSLLRISQEPSLPQGRPSCIRVS